AAQNGNDRARDALEHVQPEVDQEPAEHDAQPAPEWRGHEFGKGHVETSHAGAVPAGSQRDTFSVHGAPRKRSPRSLHSRREGVTGASRPAVPGGRKRGGGRRGGRWGGGRGGGAGGGGGGRGGRPRSGARARG